MSKSVSVEGKVALVTGANRGIGRAIVEELIAKGASKVYACARSVESLADLSEAHAGKIVEVELDVTSDESVENLKGIDDVEIVVNNAGILEFTGMTSEDAMESLERQLNVNIYGVMRVNSYLVDVLKQKDEAVLAIVSSVVGLSSMSAIGPYSVTKAGVHSMLQSLRKELKATNILVTGIYPGPIDTDMAKGIDMQKTSPAVVAEHVVAGFESGEEYIFPDPMSMAVGEKFRKDPMGVEQDFG